MKWELNLPDEAHTLALGRHLAPLLAPGTVVYLQGHLGAGKTTLSRALIGALGHPGAVKSPTYTLVEPYTLAGKTLYHFDLYRLSDAEELEFMGVRDYFCKQSLCLVEWPERGLGVLPEADLIIELRAQDTGRWAGLLAQSDLGDTALSALRGIYA